MIPRIEQTTDAALLARLNRDVQQLHHEIEPDIFKPYSESAMTGLFEDILSSSNTSAYVAFVEDAPAGYILMSMIYKEETCFRNSYAVVYIEQICVDARFRGTGVGKALVDCAKRFAHERSIPRIEMDYWSKNKNSGDFFRSQGFVNFNERLYFGVE